MPERKKPVRGLQDLRTISGKIDMVAEPYRAYMRISCLEMEKWRRQKERESAMMRVRHIDARFREIEAEKTALLRATGYRRKVGQMESLGSADDVMGERNLSPDQTKGCFKLRY